MHLLTMRFMGTMGEIRLIGALRSHLSLGIELVLAVKFANPTRLETRTKESNMCASVRVVNPNA